MSVWKCVHMHKGAHHISTGSTLLLNFLLGLLSLAASFGGAGGACVKDTVVGLTCEHARTHADGQRKREKGGGEREIHTASYVCSLFVGTSAWAHVYLASRRVREIRREGRKKAKPKATKTNDRQGVFVVVGVFVFGLAVQVYTGQKSHLLQMPGHGHGRWSGRGGMF